MPDITMCEGWGCPMKKTCYRHTATPSEYPQSFFAEPPYKKEFHIKETRREICQHYWESPNDDA